MSDITSSIPKQKLDELKTEISTWRSQKTSPQQKVPEAIWAKVAKIAPYFNAKTLAETLKLDAKQLRKRNLAVGSQLSPTNKADTTSPAHQAKKETPTQKPSALTTTAKTSGKTAKVKSGHDTSSHDKPPVKDTTAIQANQPQANTLPAKKKTATLRTHNAKTSRNVKNKAPQNSTSLQTNTGSKANQQVRKTPVESTTAAVNQDNLHPVELKLPNGTLMTVRLPLQDLLQFVKQAGEQ